MAECQWPGECVLGKNQPKKIPMKTPPKRTLVLILVSSLVVAFGTGCATVRGFGRDVESVGESINKSAR